MIQQMLAIWSLVPLPFLNPAWTSGSSQFTYCRILAWRILSITLLACEMSGSLSILWHCLSLSLEWKLTFSSPQATSDFSNFAGILSAALSQHHLLGFEIAQLEFLQVAQRLKRLPAMWETWVQSLGWEDSLEKEMATHSSILAWRIPRTEEPGGWQSMELQELDVT